MIAAADRRPRRAGITLTEILIAILIMGVGLISLATLFPLGLIRLQRSTQQARAALLFESAADDMDSRSLLDKPPFRATWYGLRDPFVQDALPNGSYFNGSGGLGVIAAGNFQLPQNLISYGNAGTPAPDGFALDALKSGLPICYDPLWRSLTGVMPNVGVYDPTLDFQGSYAVTADEARFGAGVFGAGEAHPYLRNDPNSGSGSTTPSAHGLQRLTNFVPWSGRANNGTVYFRTASYEFTSTNFGLAANKQPADVAGSIFASPDDIVFNPALSTGVQPSPLLPDLSSGAAQSDYRFTWFFTGRQSDANGNGQQFVGDIVVCDGRPFGFDPLPGTTLSAAAGETTVEAIYGYGGNSRAVLLRWRNTLADPQVRVGGWIADTTYERYVPRYRARVGSSANSFVRGYWYQVAKRNDPVADPTYPADCRSMIITLATPARLTTTPLAGSYEPAHINVATIMPSVVNVFPRSFQVHPQPQ